MSGGLDGLLLFIGCVGLLSAIAFGPQILEWVREKRRRWKQIMSWNITNFILRWGWGDDDEDVKR